MNKQLHVLVIDPSALVRESVTARLHRCGWIRASTAPDTAVARSKMRLAPPDVIVLELDHAVEAALSFLHERMTQAPLPVLVRGRDPEAIVRALSLGAADVLPSHLVSACTTNAVDRELVARIGSASGVSVTRATPRIVGGASRGEVRRTSVMKAARSPVLVAIGASTGGTVAVQEVLRDLPHDSPPVVIVIHMPAEFTGAFARHLDKHCQVTVREAQHGDALKAGLALVCPGDRHMEVDRRGRELCVSLRGGPPVSGHRPSVDVLLHSVARSCGANASGAVLTGMGRDGAEGLLALHEAGGATVVQDEASSVVFGMGREAIRLGAAGRVLPLPRIGSELLQLR